MKEGTSHRFAEFAFQVAGYGTNPLSLKPLLTEFRNGEFITINGRGPNSTSTYGMIHEVKIVEKSEGTKVIYPKSIIIYATQLYEQVIGEEDGDPTKSEESWKEISPPSEGVIFTFDWFKYRKADQKKDLRPKRLKLELEETESRCWLCSNEDPVFLQRFRYMLVTMFHREHNERLPVLKRYRKRIFTGHF